MSGEKAGPNRKRAWMGLLGLSLATSLLAIDFSIVNTALPSIQRELGAELIELRWVVALFAVVLCSFMTPLGRVGDLLGRRRLLLASLVLFTGASALAGLTQTTLLLIVARGLQGLSVAALFPTSLAAVTALFAAEKKARAIGIWSASGAVGLAVGPPLGGLIVSVASWRWIFLMNVPFAAVAFVLCALCLDRDKAPLVRPRMDWVGIPLLAVTVGGMVAALMQAPDWGLGSPWTLSLLCLSLLCLLLFVVVEKRTAEPLVDFSLFSDRRYLAASLVTFLNGFYMYVLFFHLPLFLVHVWGASMGMLGLLLLPITLCIAFSSRGIEWFTRLLGEGRVVPIGVILLVAAVGVQFTFVEDTPVWVMVLAFALFGMGWGLSYTGATTLALSSIPAEHSGVATGLFFTIRNLAGALGIAVSGLVFEWASGSGPALGSAARLTRGFHADAVLLLGLSVVTLIGFLRVRPPSERLAG